MGCSTEAQLSMRFYDDTFRIQQAFNSNTFPSGRLRETAPLFSMFCMKRDYRYGNFSYINQVYCEKYKSQ